MQVASVEEYVRVVLTKMNGTDNDDRGAVFRDRPSAQLPSSLFNCAESHNHKVIELLLVVLFVNRS